MHLLAGDQSGVAGEVFRLEPGVALRYERFRQRVPLMIGSWGPRTLALAGQIADEVKIGGSANPAMVSVVHDRVAHGAAKGHRSVDDVRIVAGAVSVVDEDGAAARALARSEVAMYLAVVAELDPTASVPDDVLDRVKERVAAGDHRGAGRAIPDEVLDLFAFSGTPGQVAAQMNAALRRRRRPSRAGNPPRAGRHTRGRAHREPGARRSSIAEPAPLRRRRRSCVAG